MNKQATKTSADYVIRVLDSPLALNAAAWNALLLTQSQPTPFMRHEFLSALHTSGCATTATGWTPRFFLLERDGELQAACALYIKSHSEGEFVFDWGWARAYHQHGLRYHPKAVCAVPFVPVPGSRLLARSAGDRALLVKHLLDWVETNHLSGLHGLFASDEDVVAFKAAGMLLRHTVQFHWTNTQPGYASFDAFLASLSQEKRKKIRQERRKVADAGVTFKVLQGNDIGQADWDFFYRCYERTYLEHGHPPYFTRAFYASMSTDMPEDWVLFIAEQHGQPIASSLIAVNAGCANAIDLKDDQFMTKFDSDCSGESTQPISGYGAERVAYGRYWGALKRVDCLHFEACYYQPLQWCIEQGYQRFEGGAQGEHKLARALLPVTTTSAHWLAHPQSFAAVDNFLTQERAGIGQYLGQLEGRSPFK